MAPSIKFSRVRRFAWPVYSVTYGGAAAGFVAELPDGAWMAYLQTGPLAGRFASRAAAAEALTTAFVPVREYLGQQNHATS
jgi:hypothetical protein